MRFNVAQLLKSEVGATREYEINEDISGLDEDLDVTAPLVGVVRVMRTSEGILVTGRLTTEVLVACRRCLQPVPTPTAIDLEEEFRPSIDIITGTPLPMGDDEDEATRIDEHHILDLTEVVRQELLLSLPVSVLCRADCRGICPQCGQNLNEEACECEPEDGDPRLAELGKLL